MKNRGNLGSLPTRVVWKVEENSALEPEGQHDAALDETGATMEQRREMIFVGEEALKLGRRSLVADDRVKTAGELVERGIERRHTLRNEHVRRTLRRNCLISPHFIQQFLDISALYESATICSYC